MTVRTAEEIYTAAVAAGFSAAQAINITAIALAESGGDDTARGDTGLQTSYWGPSFGVFQIRTVKSDTGTGSDRDISHLSSSLLAQAQAAYAISKQGTNFSPWTVYTTGKYQQFLNVVKSVAERLSDLTSEGAQAAINTVGSLNPIDTLKDLIDPVVTNARKLTIEIVAVGLGLSLVGLGVYQAVTSRE